MGQGRALSRTELRIAELASGVGTGQPQTVADLARRFGVSEDRIRAILAAVRRKLN
jgi:DNA-directed RNA polymerase sigma subunit (sigma70/sigma32)